jgi:hypothetical protein
MAVHASAQLRANYDGAPDYRSRGQTWPLHFLRTAPHGRTIAQPQQQGCAKMDDAPQLLYKIPRAARRLDCSIRQIYVLAERGELEMVHEGRSSYIVAASADAYVARLREKARPHRLTEHVTT